MAISVTVKLICVSTSQRKKRGDLFLTAGCVRKERSPDVERKGVGSGNIVYVVELPPIHSVVVGWLTFLRTVDG
jgi:hypothetical protein